MEVKSALRTPRALGDVRDVRAGEAAFDEDFLGGLQEVVFRAEVRGSWHRFSPRGVFDTKNKTMLTLRRFRTIFAREHKTARLCTATHGPLQQEPARQIVDPTAIVDRRVKNCCPASYSIACDLPAF